MHKVHQNWLKSVFTENWGIFDVKNGGKQRSTGVDGRKSCRKYMFFGLDARFEERGVRLFYSDAKGCYDGVERRD
ncbi:hypothetical protein QFZ77_002054 [Paenibacillus sp. V4I3]|nr:hypothetical protein [Paenibacillus sp. V4I3]MDQ0890686.1 hypothetical protein [Paenibacillus sp. V4I9]